MDNKAIIPLIATAAAAVAAFFAYAKFHADRILQDQYRQIKDVAARLSGSSTQPVTIAIIGLQNHGKSSFINTVHRVLYKENGPLIMRAETAPTKDTTKALKVHRIKNKLLRYPKHLMDIIDTRGYSEAMPIDEKDIRELQVLLRGSYQAQNLEPGTPKAYKAHPVECAILVMKAKDSNLAVERMRELAQVIREEGIPFLVVVTYKKEAKKSAISLQDLTETIAERTGTDLIHCMDNYIADHQDGKNGTHVQDNFETHSHTLNIVRQCFEFVKQRRQASLSSSMKGDEVTEPGYASE